MPKKKAQVKRIRLNVPNERVALVKERIRALEQKEMDRDRDFKPPGS